MSEAGNTPDETVISEPQVVPGTDKTERVKKPNRPDDEAVKQKVDALQETIIKSKAKIEKIKQNIDARRDDRTKGSGEQQVVKNKLAELRGEFQTILKQKLHLREQMDTATKTRESVKASLRDLRASMKFTTVEEIDAHIETLEERMQHSTLSLNEEKRILEDIRKLKASRATVGQYSEKLEELSSDDSTRSEIQAAIKALDEQLNAIKSKEEVLRAELAEMRSKTDVGQNDVPALLQEREELKEVCKQAYEKIKEIRAAHDAEWQEFKAADRIWRVQQQADRKARNEKLAAERAAWQAEKAARAAENAPEPFDKEITMCEQLVAHLNKFVSDGGAQNSSVEEKGEVAALDGLKPLQKKEVDDGDAWLLGKSKGGKSNKKGGKKATEERKPEKLTHSFDILEAFGALKISVPATVAAVPAVLDEVTSKKELYLKKREQAKERAENGAAATADEGAAADSGANGKNAANTTQQPGDDDAPSSPQATATEGGKKKGGKGSGGGKAAPPTPALKLEDTASWPTVGGNAATAAVEGSTATTSGADEGQDVESDKEEGEVVASPAVAAAAVAKKAVAPASDGRVRVVLTVNDDQTVSVAIEA